MNLGKLIKDLREAKGIKQETLAERANMTQAYLSQIESGKREPNFTRITEICRAIGVPVSYVMLKFLVVEEPTNAINIKQDIEKILQLYEETLPTTTPN